MQKGGGMGDHRGHGFYDPRVRGQLYKDDSLDHSLGASLSTNSCSTFKLADFPAFPKK